MFSISIVGMLFFLVATLVYLWSLFWVFGDAVRRGVPGILLPLGIALLVGLFFRALSLAVWLVVRPAGKA